MPLSVAAEVRGVAGAHVAAVDLVPERDAAPDEQPGGHGGGARDGPELPLRVDGRALLLLARQARALSRCAWASGKSLSSACDADEPVEGAPDPSAGAASVPTSPPLGEASPEVSAGGAFLRKTKSARATPATITTTRKALSGANPRFQTGGAVMGGIVHKPVTFGSPRFFGPRRRDDS